MLLIDFRLLSLIAAALFFMAAARRCFIFWLLPSIIFFMLFAAVIFFVPPHCRPSSPFFAAELFFRQLSLSAYFFIFLSSDVRC